MNKRKALLLINLGTPNTPSYWSVYKFLNQFLMDKRVLDYPFIFRFLLVNFIICPLRSFSSSKIYKKLWHPETGSPLLHNTKQLTNKISMLLPDYEVDYAMRYQNPSIEKALFSLKERGCKEVIVLPLYPHYAEATFLTTKLEVERINKNGRIKVIELNA